MSYTDIRAAQDDFSSLRWGVFHHYLWNPRVFTGRPEAADWAKNIESFDTDRLARTLHDMGAGYYFITMVHGTEYMIAPNNTFRHISGSWADSVSPRRDLVEDLYTSLSRYGIRLCLYFNASTPLLTSVAAEMNTAFDRGTEFPKPGVNVTHLAVPESTRLWAEVLREYAVRYGDKVTAWWLDSCYTWYGHTPETMKLLYDAIKAGNPNALTAFNGGVMKDIVKWYADEEFTCGEFNEFDYVPDGRFTDGAQNHILAPLGYTQHYRGGWGEKNSKITGEELRSYLKRLEAAGCPLTIDVHVRPDGTFDPVQEEILRALA